MVLIICLVDGFNNEYFFYCPAFWSIIKIGNKYVFEITSIIFLDATKFGLLI